MANKQYLPFKHLVDASREALASNRNIEVERRSASMTVKVALARRLMVSRFTSFHFRVQSAHSAVVLHMRRHLLR